MLDWMVVLAERSRGQLMLRESSLDNDGTCDKCQPIIDEADRLKVSSAQRLNALHLNFIDLT